VWLPDMSRWAQVVAALLEPGGFLYLVEGHPFAQTLDDAQGTTVERDYFDEQPQVEDYPYTYTDGPALTHTRSVEFQHGHPRTPYGRHRVSQSCRVLPAIPGSALQPWPRVLFAVGPTRQRVRRQR